MTDDAFATQMGLLRRSTEKIEMNYLRALKRGDPDPVVLMLDLREDRVGAMIGPFPQSGRAASMLAESAHRDEVPLLFWALPRREALRIAEGHLSGLAETLDDMDAGEGYHVVAVGSGGYAVVVMPPLPG